ncbi:hypothetical protein MSG28_013693 [Choristoneura fumiferana]|uniref:Uncharacterized protein n=1 Tax=Choristoneura fumiferana TaxID=7141 RepID=A0ACC0K8J5_CHOFU|nr:hypothetical protein MSG28_013693 [Choristoneura fumiferana]
MLFCFSWIYEYLFSYNCKGAGCDEIIHWYCGISQCQACSVYGSRKTCSIMFKNQYGAETDLRASSGSVCGIMGAVNGQRKPVTSDFFTNNCGAFNIEPRYVADDGAGPDTPRARRPRAASL